MTVEAKNKNILVSYCEIFFASLMVGVGESYLVAFAVKSGVGEVLSGLLATIPLLVGAVLQLTTPFAVQIFKSHKKWVMWNQLLQVLIFIPLIYFTVFGKINFITMLFISSIYWACQFSISPAWNFWFSQLIDSNISTKFFSIRTRIMQIGIFLGIVAGGLLLRLNESKSHPQKAFLFLFIFALASRMISYILLKKISYEQEWSSIERKPNYIQSIKVFFDNSDYKKFFSFLFVFFLVVHISAPFVGPFFLVKLKMSYLEFMFSIASLFVAKIICIPFVNKLIHKYGVYKVFLLGAAGVSPLPALWAFNHDIWFVCTLQAVSGALWACFEVSIAIIFFNKIANHEKTQILTLYNLFFAASIVIGSTFGGKLLHQFSESIVGYHFIFIFGSTLRCLSVIFLIVSPRVIYKKIFQV